MFQPQPLSTYLGAYGAAVTAACSISAGASSLIRFHFLKCLVAQHKCLSFLGLTYMIKKSTGLPATTRLIVQVGALN